MLQTTETLIAGLAANDETRWARFYRDYAPWIENTLLKNTPLSPPDVEDVIHETLVVLVALMPAYRHDRAGKGAFHSFVLKIAQNKAYDVLRRRTRAQNRHAAFAADPAAGPSAAVEPSFALEMSAVCLAHPHPGHDLLAADVALPLARHRPTRIGRAGVSFVRAYSGGARRSARPRCRHRRLLPPEMGSVARKCRPTMCDPDGGHGTRTQWNVSCLAERRTLHVSGPFRLESRAGTLPQAGGGALLRRRRSPIGRSGGGPISKGGTCRLASAQARRQTALCVHGRQYPRIYINARVGGWPTSR